MATSVVSPGDVEKVEATPDQIYLSDSLGESLPGWDVGKGWIESLNAIFGVAAVTDSLRSLRSQADEGTLGVIRKSAASLLHSACKERFEKGETA